MLTLSGNSRSAGRPRPRRGGYAEVKRRLRDEILEFARAKDRCREPDEIRRIEELVPVA